MVMPNIGAFIAWGLLTALFVPNGWWPDESLALLVEPMIFYLLPLLIAFTAGKLIYGQRGGVVSAVATMGMIVSTSIPMFAGAMIMGPIAAWLIKKTDEVVQKKIPVGFEMITNNFIAGIFGAILAVLCFLIVGPIVEFLDKEFGIFVQYIIDAGALSLISIFVEPAKVLFLNNAINHGVFSVIGVSQALETGKSIFFLLETNPGPGLGILLLYLVFAKGTIKQTAPGAILIHFIGGIHEIYFPYVLMQPKLILAAIAGGFSGVFVFTVLDAGLIAVPSPGSIISYVAMSPKGGLIEVLTGVVVSTVVTFVVGSFLFDRDIGSNEDAMSDAKLKLFELKGSHSVVAYESLPEQMGNKSDIKLIAVSCDAGMGSSVLGATKLKQAFEEEGVNIKVIHCAIDDLDDEIDVVITHEILTSRAVKQLPNAIHISIRDFLVTQVYQLLADHLNTTKEVNEELEETASIKSSILLQDNIKIGMPTMSKEKAIELVGQLLYQSGYVDKEYAASLLVREQELSTYIGNGVAIPHASRDGSVLINKTGISILQCPEGIDFDGHVAYLVIGIAAIGDEHLNVLSELAKIIDDENEMHRLSRCDDVEHIFHRFNSTDTYLAPSVTEEISLVIFDCDGVLVDSEIISANVLIDYLRTLGIDISHTYVQENFLGRSFSYVIENLNEHFDVELPDDIEQVYRDKLLVAFKNDLKPIEGISKVLKNLSVDFCIASSSSPERIKNSLKYTSLSEWFDDRVFSGDEVENGKPAPDLFLMAAHSMGHLPKNCLVLEDSPSGIQAAKAAHMEVIHFIGGSHLQNIEKEDALNEQTDISVINNWSEFFTMKPELKVTTKQSERD